MTMDNTTTADDGTLFLGDAWSDPIEAGIRDRIRGFIEQLIEEELAAALGRGRYQRRHRRGDGEAGAAVAAPGDVAPREGHRHGHRERQMTGCFGTVEIAVPRARREGGKGSAREGKRGGGGRGRKREEGKERGGGGGLRLILDGTVVRVRLDKKAASISLLVVLGVRRDGQKVLLAVKNMGGESEAAWRALLDDLVARGLKTPEFLIIDGAAGLEKALAALWPEVPTQRCTVHKHRNLLAHAPDHLHEEVSADYTDMIYATTPKEVEERRKAFLRKWRLKCRAVADSLEEAGDRLFTFTRLPPAQWRSARTSNAVERLHEEFKRRIKTQTVLPSPETAAMLFWALLASGQITMRKVDGWQTLATKPTDAVIDLAA